MKILSVRHAALPALLLPLIAAAQAADEQTMVVTAAPTTVSELDTPAAVSVVNGDEMRQAAPRVNLSESLGAVPGLQVQNRQNYAQDLQLSIRGFGSRSNLWRARTAHLCGWHSGHHARRPGADLKY
ncbi:tonB-dependent receptor yncD [Klebsiella pneumoniae]|nr:tonB-dependent receptor yncD [Klebsiella pneumoniae]